MSNAFPQIQYLIILYSLKSLSISADHILDLIIESRSKIGN